MTGNEMPSATGVRITGDEYQWLHAWRACMEALHHDLTKNTDNPTIAVGVEEPGVGNGDDVVRHRLRPPHVYTQVKYAVDNRTSVGLPYLHDKGILKKLATTHKALTSNGDPVEMRLATNRPHDPTDVLMKDRDGRDSRLVPRAAQDGPKSERGKARTAWATVADTDESGLMALLNDLHFDIAYELKRLRDEVALLMTVNGLRSDDNAVDQCTKWVSQQVIAGHRRLTLTDINQAISTLNLQAGSPWTTVSIATIKRDDLADQAAVSIDWVDRIDGEEPWHRVAPAPPYTWADLAAEIATVPSQLGSSRRILATGHMRQATGFLLGAELRRVLRYEVGIRQGDQLWTSEVATESCALDVNEQHVGQGSDTALIVNVAANGADQATEWILQNALPVNTILTATPATGSGPSAVTTPVAANSLAVAIRDLARKHASSGTLHMFLIGPLGLAVLLGHHWNRVTTTLVYEHLGPQGYVHAFTVDS
ncbi:MULTISPECIES: SAVED domain-containing protein [unclassified Mycolicibacterium]|uniref:SAVED domain-containing protein n=1 Tax=unclassified Mycolicibacterium TaxID=2636767 RepID=UPI0012DBE903|nr:MULTISPECIES: SAVED domain-containing protein [unclassified Mycolicibacterium]MUL82337.1 SAVED domain-containing protein [Mycolicibacterium sp. CBMA 329]MUL88103.1 SAVED domain-containing protein [Mycolicibacterium sp. CBMA 331]MUM02433.1 SAVED domain-containing protein [Mycolicibacterium sp. CBMA 334]MUM24836.1 SAVED domain-containing protein [Mycolicibacterium sp. CBMA 295]MUM38400.1 SAVED domain-containing protein [Mycolicibacterium sp. CBMA 247]